MRLLATSREKLNLRGETVYAPGGLAYADDGFPQDAVECEAAQLFIQSASQVRPDFTVQADEQAYLAGICQLTDGLPLALVLAAAWVDVLSLREIADELRQSIAFLRAEMRDAPRRHWSIRAVFEPTWERLTQREQTTFMKLAVFRGGFTRDAAEKVADADLPTLQALINKSLLQRNAHGRYDIHELLRQYGEEHLNASQQAAGARTAHMTYYAGFMQERETDIKGRNQLQGLNDVEADFDNVRTAWQWAVAMRDYENLDRMLEGAKLYCEMRNRYPERQELFVDIRQRLFPEPGEIPHPLWRRMIVRHAGFLQHQGDVRPDFQRCLELAHATEDAREIAYCLYALADANTTLGLVTDAIALYEQSLQAYRDLDDRFYMTQILNRLGALYLFSGQVERAADYGHESIAYGRQIGDKVDVGWALHTAAGLYMLTGQVSEGAKYFEEAKSIWLEFGNQEGLATALFNIAFHYLLISDIEQARELAEDALAIAANINNAMRVGCALSVLSLVASWEGDYSKALELAEQAAPVLIRLPPIRTMNYSALILAMLGLGRYDAARAHIVELIHYARQVNPYYLIAAPAFMTFFRVHQNHTRQAVALLGLCHQHRQQLGPMVSWPPFVRLYNELKDEIGEEAYNAAWEQGQMHSLESVVQAILDEFSGDAC